MRSSRASRKERKRPGGPAGSAGHPPPSRCVLQGFSPPLSPAFSDLRKQLRLRLFWRHLVFPEASQLFGLCLLVRTIASALQVFKCTREPRAPRLRGFTPGPFAYACSGPRGVSIRVAHAPRVRTPIAGLLRPAPHLVSPSVAHHGKYHLAHLVAPSRNRDIAPVRTRLSRLSSVRHQVPAASLVCPWSRCRCRPVGLVESALPSSVGFSLSMCGIRF